MEKQLDNKVSELFRASQNQPGSFVRGYLEHLAAVLRAIDEAAVAGFIEILLDARERGARIFFIGNGGSAATASHFANDVGIGSRTWDKPFRAMSLTDNVPVLTALANDYGYEEVFIRQLQVAMSPGDVVVAISASGNSSNVLRAVEYANARGAVTVSLTGFDGGRLRPLTRHNIHVATARGEYGPVEDAHMALDHMVGAYLMHACRS